MANTDDVSGLTGMGDNDSLEGSAELATSILERFGKERYPQAWRFIQAVASLVRGAMQERAEELLAQAGALSDALGSAAPSAKPAARKKAAESPVAAEAGPLPTKEEISTRVLELLQVEPLSRRALVERITGATKEQVQVALNELGARVARGPQKTFRLAPIAEKQVVIPGAT